MELKPLNINPKCKDDGCRVELEKRWNAAQGLAKKLHLNRLARQAARRLEEAQRDSQDCANCPFK